MDPIGSETYTESTKFKFECSLTGFANDKIRSFYKIDVGIGTLKGEFFNDAKTNVGKKFLNESEKITVPFKKSVAVRTQIYCTYADELKGLKNYIYMWHNGERRQEHYNNWNFTKSGPWDGDGTDSLWYNLNTTMLAQTVPYVIGKDTIKKIGIQLQPEKLVLKD